MSNLQQAKQHLETTESLKLITEALGDIASIKLKATRHSIEHTIDYFQQASVIYRVVKSVALNQKLAQKYQKPKNGRTATVLLTSNSHLYGGLDTELTKFFMDNIVRIPGDRVVVGSFGKEILEAAQFKEPFEFVKFKKDSPTPLELQNLSQKVFSHRAILVFYTKYVTVLNQEPNIADISISYIEDNKFKNFGPINYIAEPEIGQILNFFESHILNLLFQSLFLEVDLARTAARMISMNQAQENASKVLEKEKKGFLKIKKQILNMKILETYSALLGKENEDG